MKALALTIGNVKYTLPEHRLVNAVNDANDFGGNLLKLGFSVENINNCTAEQFARKIEGFGENLIGQEIGLFYYSGHGFQIENKNFLTGIDTNFYDATSARHTSISLDEIIERMRMASLRIKIIILDTCRDNPFPKTRSAVNLGLAPINAPKGTVVAFSTSPGEKAMDGGSGRNSIYTGALLKHINDPNISIEDFFKRVRTTVSTHTKGKQTSWEHTSLIGEFSFNSRQLVQSIKLPYGPNYVADVNFQSDGSKFGEAIVEMKSNDWYRQGPV